MVGRREETERLVVHLVGGDPAIYLAYLTHNTNRIHYPSPELHYPIHGQRTKL
jgi:hypothetical protein